MSSSSIKLTIALDIGARHSGYAYSLTDDPGNVVCSSFGDVTRTASSILLNKDGQFLSFGHDAEAQFQTTKLAGSQIGLLYRNFKRALYINGLNKRTDIDDVSGKASRKVYDLFVMAIRYLKNHALRALNRHVATYSENEARYVIVVPAFATDRAKWFVRQAMMQAGIEANRIALAYEGEMASLWAQRMLGSVSKKGTKYMVVNIGGDVVDIVAHQSVDNGHVESLGAPSGGLWGGENAVTCFQSFFSLLFGLSVVETYASTQLANWLSFVHKAMTDIENMEAGEATRTFTIPKKIVDMACKSKGMSDSSELEKEISTPICGGHFELHGNSLKVMAAAIAGMYQFTVFHVKNAVDTLLTHVGAFDYVIVVGGMSKCPIFRKQLQDRLAKVSFPEDGDVFTVQGAVLFGNDESLVRSRYVSVTYGLHMTVPYDESKHKEGNTVDINGIKMCTDSFHPIIRAGSKLKYDESIHENDIPLSADDKVQEVKIVSCGLVPNLPTLATHFSVNREAVIKFPLPFGCQVENKAFERVAQVGGTELSFKFTFKKGPRETFVRYLEYE
ncbi:hypothetical protein DPMN_105610 [Dreissena polymorpha]|uniref:Uncharacterized protein n=2 Tax=Dreissena polymorpha TaxID=45954 RepID=A0A9D4K3I1_DREPO|nr:hypothetical protein DPMN_105610 [Dreissena polymorpha]